MKKDYQIIYINGPSSVGKTPLARALQDSLKTPFLVFGLDQMIDMMPDKLNSWDIDKKVPGFSWQKENDGSGKPLYKNWIGLYGRKLLRTLKKVVCTLADDGHHVIIDDVSIGKKEVDAWRKALKDYTVVWIGLTAPLEILEDREKIRPDRRIGSARWQAEHVHEGVMYDLMLDTVAHTLPENVQRIKKFIAHKKR